MRPTGLPDWSCLFAWWGCFYVAQLVHPNGNKKTIALPYRFGIEKIAQIFLSEFGGCQAIVSLFRNYGLSGIKMYSNFCIKIRVQICLRTVILIQLKPRRVPFSIGRERFPLVERLILVASERKDSA